jgi:hypothetical protein
VTGAIEDIDRLCPGPYDYMDCCGVPHHLADPEAGLRSLVAELTDGGGMGLMVYGALGRRGVYDIQQSMKLLADGLDDGARLDMARRLLDGLPQSHWLRRNPFVGDHFQGGVAGLYDLLLHPRDRAYTIPGLLAFLAAGGAWSVALVAPAHYDPRNYLRDPELLERVTALPEAERWALAERLSGVLTKHIVYVVNAGRSDDPVARLTDDWRGMVPVFRDLDPRTVAGGIRAGGALKADLAPGQPYRAPLPDLASEIAIRVDGRRALADIHEEPRAVSITDIDDGAFVARFKVFQRAVGDINRLLFHRANRR